MPTVTNVNLTLTTVGANVTINVVYKVHFTPFERFLAAKGMKFNEKIAVEGVDIFASTILTTFTDNVLPVTDGATELILDRNRSKTVSRSILQEDTGAGDADEIRCKITIQPTGFPQTVEQLTEQEVLLG